LNDRHNPHVNARFPVSRVAGFPPIALMIALAFSPGFHAEAVASSKKSGKDTQMTDGHQVGKASWYGPGFHGKKTASGEVFNQNDLTAAHPRLPLGTRAKVTNLHNGKEVEVTINDRGPYKPGRIIDLSRAAAQRIALGGLARVRIETIID